MLPGANKSSKLLAHEIAFAFLKFASSVSVQNYWTWDIGDGKWDAKKELKMTPGLLNSEIVVGLLEGCDLIRRGLKENKILSRMCVMINPVLDNGDEKIDSSCLVLKLKVSKSEHESLAKEIVTKTIDFLKLRDKIY